MSFEKTRSAGYLANHMARLFAIRLTTEIEALRLAPAQFAALLQLWERDGRTQADLMEALDIEQATLANTLSRMERDGLIKRTPHPDDKRAKLIWLTDHARDLEGDAKRRASDVNKRALSSLSDQERDQFLDVMTKVIGNLKDDPQA